MGELLGTLLGKVFRSKTFRIILITFILIGAARILQLGGGMTALLLLAWLAGLVFFYRGNLLGRYAYLLHATKHYEKARGFYEAALKNGCKRSDVVLAYGMLNLQEGQFQKAREMFEKAASGKPDENMLSIAKSNLALAYWKLGDLDRAIEIAEELIKTYKTTKLYVNLGYLLILKGDLNRALQVNEEALEFNSDSAGILDNLGQIHMMQGNMEKAEEYFLKAVEKNGQVADIRYNYGTMLERSGRTTEALEQYEKALLCDITYLSTVTRKQIEERIGLLKNEMTGDYTQE